MRLEPGQAALRRYFQLGDSISVVKYARVVADDDRGLLLWVAGGGPLRWRKAADGRNLRQMPFSEWITTPKRLWSGAWQGAGILILLPPGAAHSVWWFWEPDGRFASWYINLEQPSVRWRDGALAGVDTVDQDLDIVASPDGSWRWKDEHEFEERQAYPEHYWVDDPAAVRAEGERAVKLFEARVFPFDGTWCDFRPDPAWTVPPDLPPGWNRTRAV
jgi:Protein of unknown function (DUF402)